MSDRDDLEAVVKEMRTFSDRYHGHENPFPEFASKRVRDWADRLEACVTSDKPATNSEPSQEAVLAVARRRAGGWMPKDYREANEQRIIDEAREDLRAAYAVDHANDGMIEATHQGENEQLREALEEAKYVLLDVERTRRSDAWGGVVDRARAVLPQLQTALVQSSSKGEQ